MYLGIVETNMPSEQAKKRAAAKARRKVSKLKAKGVPVSDSLEESTSSVTSNSQSILPGSSNDIDQLTSSMDQQVRMSIIPDYLTLANSLPSVSCYCIYHSFIVFVVVYTLLRYVTRSSNFASYYTSYYCTV